MLSSAITSGPKVLQPIAPQAFQESALKSVENTNIQNWPAKIRFSGSLRDICGTQRADSPTIQNAHTEALRVNRSPVWAFLVLHSYAPQGVRASAIRENCDSVPNRWPRLTLTYRQAPSHPTVAGHPVIALIPTTLKSQNMIYQQSLPIFTVGCGH